MFLEDLFHRTSHPTREEREELAKQISMYVLHISFVDVSSSTNFNIAMAENRDLKSITIWFQNKRQTERKVALNNASNLSTQQQEGVRPPLAPFTTSTCSSTITFITTDPHVRHRNVLSSISLQTTTLKARSMSPMLPREGGARRLSLDRVASRAELPLVRPRTPTHASPYTDQAATRTPTRYVWEDMPSSPIIPDASPSAQEYVDFTTMRVNKPAKRSLEWACAAARLADKTEPLSKHEYLGKDDIEPLPWGGDEDTDVDSISSHDPQEAITPDCSQAYIDVVTEVPTPKPTTLSRQSSMNENEDDVMCAAYALCGLSQRAQ